MNFVALSPPSMPSAWLDLDALNRNIQLVNHKTAKVQLRLATKSIRSIDMLKYIAKLSPNFIGLMSYAADESVYLLENGFDNILCAYPTIDRQSVAKTFRFTQEGAVMTWMVDDIEQAKLLNQVAKKHHTQVNICLDINMSMPLPKLYFGTKRSSILTIQQLKKFVKQVSVLSNTSIVGIMGYEAQIAGLSERVPSKTMLAPLIRLLKKRSKKQVSRRRKSVVAWLSKHSYPLRLVNGGGSGSMEFTSNQTEITEITVGSAYYKPAYFDYMDTMQKLHPAAGFVLPVTRVPEKNVITCHSGGFIASGAQGSDKNPVVHYPNNLSLLSDEGYGEVQTPMQVNGGVIPNIGDSIWCRHAKAGELCEHFTHLICYQDAQVVKQDGIIQTMTTYRGDGRCFH